MNKEIMLIMQMVQHNFNSEFNYNTSDINWDSVINILLDHRIFINAYKILVKIAPKQYMNMIEQTYDDLKHQISINISKLEEFASEAEKEHVRFVLVKGLGLAQIIYNDYFLRQANDLDILVENDDMIRGDFILKKLGYKQPNILNYETLEYTELDYPIMRLRHTNHYFEYYTMDRKKWCKVELHKKLYHISMEYIDDFLWNTSQIDIKSKKINTLNLHYSLIMQFANTFENSETLYSIQGGNRIREYIDLYNFLEKFKNEINWEEIKKLLTKYGLVTITRIVIDNLAELYNNVDLLSYKDFLAGSSDEENVELWNLPLNIFERMFDNEKTRYEIHLAQKAKAFCSDKVRFPVYQTFDLKKMWKLETTHDVLIQYQLTYYDDGIKLFIVPDRKLIGDIKNYLFQLIIYNNLKENPCLYSLLEITFEDEPIVHVINTPIFRDSNVLRKRDRGLQKKCLCKNIENDILLEADITFEEMGISFEKNDCEFAVSFNWFKYMQPLTYHHMEYSAESLYSSYVITFI